MIPCDTLSSPGCSVCSLPWRGASRLPEPRESQATLKRLRIPDNSRRRSLMEALSLSLEQAASLARLPMGCIQREYPNAPGIYLESAEDLRRPSEIHPAFYGCLDWHSAVHGHWM